MAKLQHYLEEVKRKSGCNKLIIMTSNQDVLEDLNNLKDVRVFIVSKEITDKYDNGDNMLFVLPDYNK